MTTLSGNGGARQLWRNTSNRSRLALCRNGKMLKQPAPGERWRFTILRSEDIAGDPAWRSETTTVASAGITRTTRQARHKLANQT
ncbi:MAG: hypothetical protein J2P48_18035 [Alphaproteobacteria bacterium]|nr:hypothetical protein [Alphaproteobacteria bacterium]